MPELKFERLKKRLLLGGVAPKYCDRIVKELKSHYAELVERELKNGASAHKAKIKALSDIGKEDEIVDEALAKPAIMSWSRRYTKTIYLGFPAVLYVSTVFLFLYVMTVLTRDLFGNQKKCENVLANDWNWHYVFSRIRLGNKCLNSHWAAVRWCPVNLGVRIYTLALCTGGLGTDYRTAGEIYYLYVCIVAIAKILRANQAGIVRTKREKLAG